MRIDSHFNPHAPVAQKFNGPYYLMYLTEFTFIILNMILKIYREVDAFLEKHIFSSFLGQKYC